MALIKCPECGKEISSTTRTCIHCGCPIKNKKKIPKKLLIILFIIFIVAIAVFFIVKIFSTRTIQHTKLFELMDYKQPASIKRDLGDGYEYKTYDRASSSEDYEDIVVDGLPCSLVEISYDYGDYERILFEVSDITTDEKNILVKDFLAQYGKEYDYEEDEYNGRMIYEYTWNIDSDRRISLSIHESKQTGMYWLRINSFHKWLN